MSREVKTLPVAAEEEGIRLDRWIRRRWPHVSHIQVQKLARSGQIRVDGSRELAKRRHDIWALAPEARPSQDHRRATSRP